MELKKEAQEWMDGYDVMEDVYYDVDVEMKEALKEEQQWCDEDLDEGYLSSESSTLCSDDYREFW